MKTVVTPKYIVGILMLITAGFMLLAAQSAYWLNHTVFDQESFTSITSESLLSSSSRSAIATEIVNRALDDRPVIKRLIGSQATSLIDGFLGSNLSRQLISSTSRSVYGYITSSNRQDIAIDLSSVKTAMSGLFGVVQQTNPDIIKSVPDIPERIVVVESDSLPDLSGVIRLALIAGPVLWLGSGALFLGYVLMDRTRYARRIYQVSATIAIVCVLGLFFGPYVPPIVASLIGSIDLRIVASNLTQSLLVPFISQVWFTLGVTIVATAVFSQRSKIIGGLRTIGSKLSSLDNKAER